MKNQFFILALLVLSCSKGSHKTLVEKEFSGASILIKNVSIFNGRDSTLLLDKDVLIEGSIIMSIADNLSPGMNTRVVDGKGKTLMPGLIDSHVHLSGSGAVPWENQKADIAYNLQAYLYAGITTIYDLGGLASNISGVGQKVEEGKLLGPSVYNTHIPITVKNSHPIPLTEVMLPWPLNGMVNAFSPTLDVVSEAPELMEKYVSNDIDYVKIICDQIPPGSPQMSPEQLDALIEEAHQQNMKVFVHIGSPQNALDAINAGADVLAHGVWRGELSEEQAKQIAGSGVPIIYTLSGFKNVACIHHGKFSPSELDKRLIPHDILAPVTEERGKDVHEQEVMNKFFADVAENSTHWEQNFALLHKHGAKILVGTDSNLPGTYAGATYLQELYELKRAGMSNFEILRGATYLNARLFLSNPDFGLIEEGKKADLLLLDGNPLDKLEAVEDAALIVKAGQIVRRVE